MTEQPYEIKDPSRRILAFRDSAPMPVRAHLYQMLFGLMEQPRLDGEGYTVLDLGAIMVARLRDGAAAVIYSVDELQKWIKVVDVRHMSLN